MQKLVLSLTLFRILSAPFVFISAIFIENYWLAFWLFNIAALTDYFDGKLARTYQVESRLGAILDPIGDKLLVLFTIITVMVFTQDSYVALIGVFILAREFWVSALREYSSSQNNSKATTVTFIAKTKTMVQFIALSMYLLGSATDLALMMFIASFVLFVAALLALKSAIDYTYNALRSS